MMKWLLSKIRRIKYDFIFVFLSYFVANIPFWTVRRFFYISSGMKIGKSSRIGMKTVVVNPRRVFLGDRVIVNESCCLDGRGGLVIEDDTSISFGTTIISASHKANSPKFEYYENKVHIGKNVWIGAHAIILDGSQIEDFVIIGAGSVAKGTYKKGGVYIGNPTYLIKMRESLCCYEIDYRPFFR